MWFEMCYDRGTKAHFYEGGAMKIYKAIILFLFFIFGAVSNFTGCGGGGSSPTTPTQITASWTGGAVGAPTERKDVDAETWAGHICPANSLDLINYGAAFAGLNVINNCADTVTYALCATKGSLPQPADGLQECAEDPFQTPLTQLTIKTLANGLPGDFINATQELSINVFFCGDSQTLTGPPLMCQ